jgi:hypothetical protein
MGSCNRLNIRAVAFLGLIPSAMAELILFKGRGALRQY